MPLRNPTNRHRDKAPAAAFALVAAIVLGGCAVAPPTPSAPAAARPPLPAFELAGRLSATDGEQAVSGRMEWTHSAAGDTWTAFSPLGQIVARLEHDAAGARLITADGRRLEAADADTLLPQVLGVDAPFDQLPRWVQGVPQRSSEVRRTDEVGRPLFVVDRGWLIEYTEYATPGADALPRRVEVHRGDTRIRLIIDQWSPPALAAVPSTTGPRTTSP